MCRKDAGWSCIWYAAFVLIRESRFYVHPICLLQTVARRRYLGCVFCSLMYRYVEVQAKACLQADIQVLRRRNTIFKREKRFDTITNFPIYLLYISYRLTRKRVFTGSFFYIIIQV